MGRSRVHSMTITQVPGRPKPWAVRWKANLKNGERVRRSKFFPTEAEAIAFKTQHEAIAATLLPPPKPKAQPSATTTGASLMAAANAPRGTMTLRAFARDWISNSRRSQTAICKAQLPQSSCNTRL